MEKLKVASVFSGGFGSTIFALKYENIDFEEVFAVEWMKPQRKSHILNHGMPTSTFYEDATQFNAKKYKGQIDLLQLSPPCQSYSLAGNRGGAADDRGDLVFRAIEIIDHIQPKQFFIENVKGLLSSNGGEDWKNILRDVRSLKGYTVTWGVMNAKDQGTPQNRERVFIVGFRGKCMPMPFPERIKLDKCLADVLEEVVDEKYYLSDKSIEKFIIKGGELGAMKKDEICKTLRVGGRSSLSKKHCFDLIKVNSATKDGYETAQQGDSINLTFPNSKTRRGRVGKSVAQTLDTAYNQGVIVSKIMKWYEEEHKDMEVGDIIQTGQTNMKGQRIYKTGIAPTLPKENPRVYSITRQERIRRLTPRECSRVQGDFKDMFKQGDASDTKLYEFIGNAMDISTTRNLLKAMFAHKVEFGEPLEPSFVRKEVVKSTLF